MAKSSSAHLDACFAALAHPTRRAIVERLLRGEATVGELATPFQAALPTISKHIAVLEAAGLVERERKGRVHRCRIRPHPLREAQQWMNRQRRFWESTFDSLEAHLATLPTPENDPNDPSRS